MLAELLNYFLVKEYRECPLPPILASATVSVSTHLAMSLMSLITQSHLPKFHASS